MNERRKLCRLVAEAVKAVCAVVRFASGLVNNRDVLGDFKGSVRAVFWSDFTRYGNDAARLLQASNILRTNTIGE